MSASYELSADDPSAVAEAIERAVAGEVVHLVRDGRPIAALVPHARGVQTTADLDAKADQVVRTLIAHTGAVPTLDHYRHIFLSLGQPWPGDDQVRRLLPVATAS